MSSDLFVCFDLSVVRLYACRRQFISGEIRLVSWGSSEIEKKKSCFLDKCNYICAHIVIDLHIKIDYEND